MAQPFERPLLDHPGLVCGATTLAAKQHLFVKQHTDGTVIIASAIGDQCLGVLQDAPAVGESALVEAKGFSKITLGATLVYGDRVVSGSDGKAIKPTGADQFIMGTIVQGGASGELGTIRLETPYKTQIDWWDFPLALVAIANGDVLTGWTPGYAGKILAVEAQVTQPATTGSKLSTLNLEINATNVTGGAVALTSANCTPIGARVAGSAVTAADEFDADDTIAIEAASTTAFVEGWVNVKVKVLKY